MSRKVYENIKALAKANGIKLGDLERKVGLSQGTLARYKDNMTDMKFSHLITIANLLGTTVEGLMTVDYVRNIRADEIRKAIAQKEREIEALKNELVGLGR